MADAQPTKQRGTNAADVSVAEYGATGDGNTIDTVAIQRAIDDCAARGGGSVRFERGVFVSGTLCLRSGVRLVVEEGATLRGSSNHLDYGEGSWADALIKGDKIEDFSIEGAGTIDGADCKNPTGEEGFRGPHGVLLSGCRQFTIAGVKIANIGNYAILCNDSSEAVVEKVSIRGGHDGVHANRCVDFAVRECDIRTGDDSFAGCDNRNFVVTDCKVNSSCNGFRFGCVDFIVERCHFWGPGEAVHQVSSRTNMISAFVHFAPIDRNPTLPSDNWLIKDCTIDNAGFVYGYDNEHGLWQKGQPARRVRFENVKATRIAEPIRIRDGVDRQFCLTLENVSMALSSERADQPLIVLDRFGELTLRNVEMSNAGNAPVLNARNGRAVTLDGGTPDASTSPARYRVEDVARLRRGRSGGAGEVAVESFEALQTFIEKGQEAELRWKVRDASDVDITPGIGAVPSEGSRSVRPSEDTTYTITARSASGAESASTTVRLCREADQPQHTVNGLHCSYFEGSWDALPDFGALTPAKKSIVTSVDASARARDDSFGLVFTGYVSIPAPGVYMFYAASDDGSSLSIGDRTIVNNDGLHGVVERSGAIALGAGLHAIRISFFEKSGGQALAVSIEGPGIAKRVLVESDLRVEGPAP